MKKQATLVLAVLLVFGIFAGSILAHSNNDQQGRDHMGGQMHGHMGVGFLEEEISEEERNIIREILRKTEKMQALREEYRQQLLAEAPQEELRPLEDEIIELQTELEKDRLRIQEKKGFSGRGFRTMHGDFFGTGTHCW